jgi:hypothetical protein
MIHIGGRDRPTCLTWVTVCELWKSVSKSSVVVNSEGSPGCPQFCLQMGVHPKMAAWIQKNYHEMVDWGAPIFRQTCVYNMYIYNTYIALYIVVGLNMKALYPVARGFRRRWNCPWVSPICRSVGRRTAKQVEIWVPKQVGMIRGIIESSNDQKFQLGSKKRSGEMRPHFNVFLVICMYCNVARIIHI